MHRRDFLAGAASAAGASSLGSALPHSPSRAAADDQHGKPFGLKYAPHFGMFRHHAKDPIDQIKFMADEGFRAFEDNGMRNRPVAMQERIAKELQTQKMEMGVFVAHADFRSVSFATRKKTAIARIKKDMRAAVEIGKRVNARWCTVVPGRYDQGTQWEYQTAYVIDNLKRAAEICEPSGLTMVLEPLNPWTNHAGLFLTKIPQAYQICRAVGSPSCKILNDLYHQQITEGQLVPNINQSWSEIAYFQTGDNPGRKEPTTGEINYKFIFRHLKKKGFEGIIGMEHGNSKKGKAGERAVIDAYRACDAD